MKSYVHRVWFTGKVLFAFLVFFTVGRHVQGQANNLCGNAIVLTSSTSCSSTAGSLTGATTYTTIPTIGCGTTNRNDVWYSFVAETSNPTITLSSVTFANARLQLFSGSCGSLSSVICGNSSMAPTGLTIGSTYFIRVYSSPNATGTFNICVTDPAPANDLCGSAILLTSGASCTTTAGNMVGATYTAGSGASACSGTDRYDVWYSFVAQTPNPTVTISAAGAGFISPQVQILSGSCGSFTSIGCGAGSYTAAGLTLGTTYYVRVFSTSLPVVTANGTFNICITDPQPANDLCSNAVSISSAATCVTTAGTLAGATYTAVTAACGSSDNDVWYTFVAQTTNPTIKLTTTDASARVQVYSGSCGSPSSVGCSPGLTYTPTGLTVGATYLVRVYSNTVPSGTFTICITDPAAPTNDDCTGAKLLGTGMTCSTTAGTLLNADATAGVPGDCGATGAADVWYKFVAQSVFPTITISSVGADFSSASPRIQLLSGGCGSMSSLACVSSTSLNTYTTPGPTSPLTVGATYYIRLYSNSPTMSGTAWGFNICVTEQPITDFGKSYANISKGAGGGTIEPGDILEVRAIFVLKGGSVTAASFLDTVPANTTYVPNTLRILTNEGQLYKQWTDGAADDPGTILSGSFITINLGKTATAAAGGTVNNTDRPTNFGSTCIMVVSYQVKVNAVAYGTTVDVGGGKIKYTNTNGYISNINFPKVTAVVYNNYGICSNTIGTNGVLSEFGGTFGSGNPKDRLTSSSKVAVNYTLSPFSNGNPGDYFYGISNNSSSGGVNYSINPNDPVAVNHVFNVWDIIGDHTGAASPTAGNPPADTTGGKTGGYMVVINSAYRTDTAFVDTIRNLCPNTYYEYSAWFRNICRKCSGDSTGKGPTVAGYVPTGPGDSSGVHPNLTFNISGFDYYTTGDILYTGQWVKKGFTYLTGPSQTQMTVSIRNNAPGGGGNDWAIDDIGVATCTPNLAMNPSTPTLNVCYGDGASLSADVQSYFNNYTEYIWEKSIDNGVTYTPTGFGGTGAPLLNAGQYHYTATGPSFIGDSSVNNNVFRLRVASTPTNLSDANCSFSALRTVKVYVHNCLWLLKAEFLNASGILHNNLAVIQWTTANETGKTSFEIEKSLDGNNFNAIGKVSSNAVAGNGTYTFNDPNSLTGPSYYQIKIIDESGFRYSKIILLSPDKLPFEVKNLVNPFSDMVSCDLVLPEAGNIRITVLDNYGRVVKNTSQLASKGITPVKLGSMGNLSSGIYSLKIEWQNQSIIKRIVKTNN